METQLVTNIQNRTSVQAIQDFVQLEQEEWKADSNTPTKGALANFMSSVLYGSVIEAFNCNVDSSFKFEKFIYAYPDPNNLQYSVGLTHGFYTKGVREQLTIEETISLSFNTEVTLRYPPSGNVTISSLPAIGSLVGSKFRDSEGNIVPMPTFNTSGKTVIASKPVYGAIKASYKTYKHTYLVFIPVREDSVENRFQSVFYARWAGGANLEAIKVPNNADSDYEAGLDCKSRSLVNGGGSVVQSGGYEPPKGYSVETTKRVDYCSQAEK